MGSLKSCLSPKFGFSPAHNYAHAHGLPTRLRLVKHLDLACELSVAKAIAASHVPVCTAVKNSTAAVAAACWTQGDMEGTGSSRLLLTSASSEVFQLAGCRVVNLSV